jgi:type I restriction enzyme S subunit
MGLDGDLGKSHLVQNIIQQLRILNQVDSFYELISGLENDQQSLSDIIGLAKNRILDLAICGKLVPQNPDDEPASVMLERIRIEKEELIKAGKIKRDKKESVIFKGEDNSYYRNYENESVCIDENIPFEIPSNWEWCNLSMIGSTNIGLTYKPEDIIENGTMVLRSSNIVNGKIDLSDLVRVKTSIRDNQYIEENDILICARNGSKALVGKCAIFSGISERASFGAFMAVYRTAFFKYVYYFLNSNTFRSTFNSDDTKQINQLTQDMIKNSLIPLPPFEEQLRIVETIENVFAQLETIAESLN